jgi:hypothetical protein
MEGTSEQPTPAATRPRIASVVLAEMTRVGTAPLRASARRCSS